MKKNELNHNDYEFMSSNYNNIAGIESKSTSVQTSKES